MREITHRNMQRERRDGPRLKLWGVRTNMVVQQEEFLKKTSEKISENNEENQERGVTEAKGIENSKEQPWNVDVSNTMRIERNPLGLETWWWRVTSEREKLMRNEEVKAVSIPPRQTASPLGKAKNISRQAVAGERVRVRGGDFPPPQLVNLLLF